MWQVLRNKLWCKYQNTSISSKKQDDKYRIKKKCKDRNRVKLYKVMEITTLLRGSGISTKNKNASKIPSVETRFLRMIKDCTKTGKIKYEDIYLISLSDLFYLFIAGGEAYCCTWSHAMTHSARLLRTRDQPAAETSTRQHTTTLTRDTHPCPPRDSNPQSQQASSRTPTPHTARPPRYVCVCVCVCVCVSWVNNEMHDYRGKRLNCIGKTTRIQTSQREINAYTCTMESWQASS
jgi:hypothetical protein